jgi:hypothetical protein
MKTTVTVILVLTFMSGCASHVVARGEDGRIYQGVEVTMPFGGIYSLDKPFGVGVTKRVR